MIKLIIEIKEDDHQVGIKFETIPTQTWKDEPELVEFVVKEV